ncbi:PREDICTED: interleukin-4 [Elephantulus edwardii]|uniref:interleukin-4 n=1 Tax=Elephantulus edwardii TaxID=28737 RepID=UPI0003F0A94A|nr:PREDICTED: interleukin-4 [Elephantulus edwardii]
MAPTSHLIPILFCLLVYTSNFVHGHHCGITLKEIIKTLNYLTVPKHACNELMVADVFAVPKKTSEQETFCKARTVLEQVSSNSKCSKQLLRGLSINLTSMTESQIPCPVNKAQTSTLLDFLKRLKTVMMKKYSKCKR